MIEFTKVTKKYGNVKAIDRMDLNIPDKGIYCLLGRNGAGKTTLMKLIAGYIGATEGIVTLDGKHVSPGNMPKSVNFIESGAVQFNMKVSSLIDAAASLQKEFDIDFAVEMMERFELNPQKKYKQLSFGMKTMLSAIITLANNSKVIMMDEPTLGFDAIMRDQFNTLLLESYHAHPRTIIVSTHLIDEIAKITEKLIIINNGRILVEADMDDIDERAYTLTGLADKVIPLLDGLRCIGKTAQGSMMAAHIYDERIEPPEGVIIGSLSLQDFFINIAGGKNHE